MPLQVKQVAHIARDEIIVTSQPVGDFVALLTNIEATGEQDGPIWVLPLDIGEGPSKRHVRIELARFIPKKHFEESFREPLRITSNNSVVFVLFRNRFFVPERTPMDDHEREELTLRVKRSVYKQEEELGALRSYVSNMEAAFEHQRSGPKRVSIPADVRLAVWSRDGGLCVRCGSNEKLHFDHIIPVVKGGGNDVRNVQILCEPCNLKKSDKIGF